MSVTLTPAQRAAVENRGGGLLVSAAAGSGKTRVLVERLLRRVADEGRNVDEFLIITYTKAAAAELRGRIAQELSARLAAAPHDRHLRRQTNLVYSAQISTVHAFCASMLRECAHLLDLDPDFRLCDEGEAAILQGEALDRVLEGRYETVEEGSDFAHLVDTMSAGRDDGKLVRIALDIYARIQSHPRPAAWLRAQEALFALDGVDDPARTPWGAFLLENARLRARHWLGEMEKAHALCLPDYGLEPYAASVGETVEGLRDLILALDRGWDAAAAFCEIPFPRLKAIRNCARPDLQARVKSARERCKKRMGKVAEVLSVPGAALLADMKSARPAIRALFSLVLALEEAYRQEKNRRGLLDFSDLEHLAVELLTDEAGSPTETARAWSGRFAEIMVDEYQDTNEVQNAIFTALSHEGKNLFMVGDVKQSIYRFRLADPAIFLQKYRDFRDYTEAEEGEERRILLSQNFRSRTQVLGAVNDLFSALMSREFGEMDYTDDEALYPGAAFPAVEADLRTELHVLDLPPGAAEEGERTAKDLTEARFAAARIETLVAEGFPVADGGSTRPARWDDVVILLRSPGAALHHYLRALDERGIPWQAEGGGDFFAATEISVALSFLAVIDNPRQDVPLISVLRSPAYRFSADRLAHLRAAAPEGDFYAAVAEAAARGEQDCAAFLKELADLRDRAADLGADRLIWQLYDRTGLPELFGALPNGEERIERLYALCALARRFEERGHRGLFGFLAHLERLQKSGAGVGPGLLPGRGEGVRILSIHRSKGLEFPVVLLCGLSRRLNREDMQKPVLFHSKLGVGPKGLDIERAIEYPTLARMAVAAKLESEMMAEELRLLYVAMTRAQDKLIMTCALPDAPRRLGRLAHDAGCPVEPQALAACQSVGEWVLLAALARPEAQVLREAADWPHIDCGGPDSAPWEIALHDGASFEKPPATRADRAAAQVSDGESGPSVEELAERFGWRYPHQAACDIPSKLTATGLKGRYLDDEAAQDAAPAGEGVPSPQAAQTESESVVRPARAGGRDVRPWFAWEERPLTGAERGTALHLFMQYMDFSKGGSAAGIEEEKERMVALALLTKQQAAAVETARVAAFFQSDLGRAVAQGDGVRREHKFSVLLPAAHYFPEAGAGETVLLQGVVDCWFETEGGLVLLDFKTDRVTEQTVRARADEYRPQLDAYSRALTEMTGKPVRRRVLWFFALDGEEEV